MEKKEAVGKFEEIKDKIELLPKGYLSKKNIKGKIKYYLQWTEDGKKISKYISDDKVAYYNELINLRRKYQEELKLYKDVLVSDKKINNTKEFYTHVRIGDLLFSFAYGIKGYKKRDCYEKINKYLYGENNNKVLILYGLRRTGKTTLIRQAISEMSSEDFIKTAFIQITNGDELGKLNFDIQLLEKKGYKYIFIDEVTMLEDFIEGSALFSDIYATSGMKIILSGTDSLGFMLAEDEQLYDRCEMIHTTFIPYGEFERVLEINSIDAYIQYGGTMSMSGVNYNESSTFVTPKLTSEYIDSSIAKNIQHSLKYYQYGGHFRDLEKLYEVGELTNVINRVVEDVNHRFTLDVLTKKFKSNDLSISANNIRKDRINGNDILDKIDKELFTNRLKEMLEIRDSKNLTINITETHKEEIEEYLHLLDLVEYVDVISASNNRENRKINIITQPGMRYSQAKSLVKSLLLDEKFKTISALDRKYILDRILSEIKGRMLEDIILLETKKSKPQMDIFKLQFDVGEFDMVVVDNDNVSVDIFEIKYSDKVVENQYKYLIDEEKCKMTEFRFGAINNKYVIYRGEEYTLDNGIKYLNAQEYLKKLNNM